MVIPDILKAKIMSCFGPEGETWLERLPGLVQECLEKWQLSNCKESDVMSYNYVCFADSPQYGQVALKVGIPHFDLRTEMAAIKLYNGLNICQCYQQEPDLGAMLLERISPGNDLTTLESGRERMTVAAKIAAALPIVLETNPGLPSWSELAQNTFRKLRDQNNAGEKMLSLIDRAEQKIRDLENSGRPMVLLHGDLHHWNILKDGEGSWKAIDPKGQVGVACMEAGRFMLNELEIAAPDKPSALMDEMTAVYSEKLGEPRSVIALVAFLDKALSTSWKFEEHEQQDRTADVEECQFLYNYYLSLG